MVPKNNIDIWEGGGIDSEYYKLACEQEDYLSVLYINNIPIIVLGDEPLPTIYILIEDVLFLLRFYWINNENIILNYLKDFLSIRKKSIILEEEIIKEVERNWVLFDGAYKISDSPTEIIDVTLPNVECKIQTYKYEVSDASFLIHIFESK